MNIEEAMPTTPLAAPELPALLESATKALNALGIKTAIRRSDVADARVDMQFSKNKATYLVECKRYVNSTNLGSIAHRLATVDTGLLVAEYIAPPVADRLRELHIQFVDTAGNAYLHAPPILIWVSGRKPEKPHVASRMTRAFQPGGIKLIFALLCKPELASTPYRTIAEAADVALGTVGWVMRDLQNEKYLLDLGKRGRKLVSQRKLLEQWTEGYARQLRPKLLIGRFRSLSQDWQQHMDLPVAGAAWGGESAAARMTSYLNPEIATIYLHKNPTLQSELTKKLRLVKDSEGNVELREVFWHFDVPDSKGVVPPLLVYADLLATAEDRNIETARIIYDEHLARLIEQA